MSCQNRTLNVCHGSKNFGKICVVKLYCAERRELNKRIKVQRVIERENEAYLKTLGAR